MRKRPIAISYPEADDMGEHEIQRLIAELSPTEAEAERAAGRLRRAEP